MSVTVLKKKGVNLAYFRSCCHEATISTLALVACVSGAPLDLPDGVDGVDEAMQVHQLQTTCPDLSSKKKCKKNNFCKWKKSMRACVTKNNLEKKGARCSCHGEDYFYGKYCKNSDKRLRLASTPCGTYETTE